MPDKKDNIFDYKIAYISDQRYPIEKADSEQVVNTVSALTSEGLDIRLVIPREWRNLGASRPQRLAQLKEFYHLKNGFYSSELLHLPPTPLRLEKYSHGMVAPLWAKSSQYDLVYTRNPLPAFLSTFLGMKVVFETYRVYGKTNYLLARLLRKLSFTDNLIGIITHSHTSKESLVDQGALAKKITVIHNGFNPELFSGTSKSAARAKLNLPGNEKIACYSGRLDREKGIGALLELAARTPEITYLLIGKSQKDSEDWIDLEARDRGLKNIRRLCWKPTQVLIEYLYASDVLLIPPTAAPLEKFGKTVLPIKLFQYLAAGRPILAPGLPDSQAVLNDKNSVLVAPDNYEQAEQDIRRIFDNPRWADVLARQAQQDSQNYTWRSRAQKIIAFLNERLTYNDRPS